MSPESSTRLVSPDSSKALGSIASNQLPAADEVADQLATPAAAPTQLGTVDAIGLQVGLWVIYARMFGTLVVERAGAIGADDHALRLLCPLSSARRD